MRRRRCISPSAAKRSSRQIQIRRESFGTSTSSAVAAFEFGKARVTGKKPNLGEKRKVTVDFG